MTKEATMRFTCADLYTPRDAQNLRPFHIWILSATLLFLASTILLSQRFLEPGPIAWVLVAATIAAFAMAIAAYIRFLRYADELLRKIQIEGLAAGFGAGMLFMVGWRLCERLGAPKLDIDDPFIVMITAFAVGQWMALRRYASEETEAEA